jgi:hypothetical protein
MRRPTSRLVTVLSENSAPPAPVIEALQREEARKAVLVREIAILKAQQAVTLEPAAIATLKGHLQERAADVRGLLDRHPALARQGLRKILVGRLTFVPLERDGAPVGYRFTGQATLGRLLTGETAAASRVGGPNGIRTRVSALRGPCPRPLDDGAVRLPCCARPNLPVHSAGKLKWLGVEGSNPHYQGQNLASYH